MEEHRTREEKSTRRTAPHSASLAVWDVPSPVAAGRRFAIKVGATCASACDLTGQAVAVRDERGVTVGGGELGAEPWPGTRALRWAEVELIAPATTGVADWVVVCAATRSRLAHGAAPAPLAFVVDWPPAHRVTLTVVAPETRAPIGGADLRIGAYRAVTDSDGVGRVDLPPGVYGVALWADGYVGPPTEIAVAGDLAVEIVAVRTLTAAERDARLEELEARQWG